MIRPVIVCLFLGLITVIMPVPVEATDYYLGVGGHYYQHGSSVPYYRTQSYVNGYNYQQGCYTYYQPGYYTYQYYAVPNYVAPATVAPAAVPGWRAQLLKIAAEKQEHNEYMEAVRALGLTVPNVNYGGQYGSYSSLNLGYYGANANTIFGYQPQPLTSNALDLFGQTDLNALYQAVARGVESNGAKFAEAQAGHQALVGEAGRAAARVAEIRARGDLITKFAASLEQPRATIQAQKLDFGPTPPASSLPTPQAQPETLKVDPKKIEALWQQSAITRCASCHGGKDASGKIVVEAKYNIFQFPAMSAEDRQLALDRIASSDPAKRMPKGKDSLPAAERSLWLQYATLGQ